MSNLIYISDPPFAHDRKSADFDGAAAYMANTNDNLIGISNAWTVSIWALADRDTNFEFLFDTRKDASNVNQIGMTLRGDDPSPGGAPNNPQTDAWRVNMADSSGTKFKDYYYKNAIVTDSWMHLVATWDGTNLKMYYNGTDITASTNKQTDNAGTMTDTERKVYIGRRQNAASDYFDGVISNVAVWNVALDQSNVDAVYKAGVGEEVDYRRSSGKYDRSSDLKHWWRIGFKSASTNDIGLAYARAGKIDMNIFTSISPAQVTEEYPGLDDKAVDLDGSTERFKTTAQDNTLGFVNELTFFISYKAGTKGWVCQVASATQALNQIRVLNGNSGQQFRVLLGTTAKDYYNSTIVSSGTWFTGVFTWDGTNLKLYVDGAEIAVTKGVDGALTRQSVADESVSFGSSFNGGAAHSDGRIHSAAFWNKVLSPAEILAIHNSGDPGSFNLKKNQGHYESAGNLVQWWRHGWKGAAALGDNEISSGASLDEVNITGADIVTDRPS